MPRERDSESGQYREAYPPEDFVEAIQAADGMAGTKEIAERVGCSYNTAYHKLTALAEDDRVTNRTAGNTFMWLLTDDS